MRSNQLVRGLVIGFLTATFIFGVVGFSSAWRKGGGELPRQYERLLESADRLWSEYKSADAAYFDHGRTDTRTHALRLADIQDRLANVHGEWMGTDAPPGLEAVDMKVGLALELQMAAIGAELVALFSDDQSYMELSAELDSEYEVVVNDL